MRLDRIVVLVRSYDEAIAFYTHAFDCSILHDSSGADGKRFVHLAFPEGDAGLWLLESDDERVGDQTAGEPLMVLYTHDLIGAYEKLSSRGVALASAITRTPEASFFHCADLYGNGIVVMQD